MEYLAIAAIAFIFILFIILKIIINYQLIKAETEFRRAFATLLLDSILKAAEKAHKKVNNKDDI